MLDFLTSCGVNSKIIDGLKAYRAQFPWQNEKQPVTRPRYYYYGRRVWEMAAAALLAGENLLLTGPKATGKNVLAENLAAAFGRPYWNVSFHINMDASFMIGGDTFENGRVSFRPGPVYECAKNGGFGVLDEINMARNEALAVLHSLLDFRRVLETPGYERLELHPATRFIATMNYGYAGTRELNEALASRFVVLHLPPISEDNLKRLLKKEFPGLKKSALGMFSGFFFDLLKKCGSGEISSKAVDLRGLIDSLRLIERGLTAHSAISMGISGKIFDEDERELVDDVITLRFPKDLEYGDIFEDAP